MCVRGGYPSADNKRNVDAPKLNWTRDVFTRLANHTDTHKATSVGHDLITHYQNYLVEYESEHPEDTSENLQKAVPAKPSCCFIFDSA